MAFTVIFEDAMGGIGTKLFASYRDATLEAGKHADAEIKESGLALALHLRSISDDIEHWGHPEMLEILDEAEALIDIEGQPSSIRIG